MPAPSRQRFGRHRAAQTGTAESQSSVTVFMRLDVHATCTTCTGLLTHAMQKSPHPVLRKPLHTCTATYVPQYSVLVSVVTAVAGPPQPTLHTDIRGGSKV